MIDLLSELGYSEAISSHTQGRNADEPEKWIAVFSKPNHSDCKIEINSRSTNQQFSISHFNKGHEERLLVLDNPFEEVKKKAASKMKIIEYHF